MLRPIVFGLSLLVGFGIILFHKNLVDLFLRTPEQSVALATATSDGSGEILDREQRGRPIRVGEILRDQDTLTATSKIMLQFAGGMEIEIQGIAFFENTNKGVYVSMRTGQYRVVSKGSRAEKIYFVKDGFVSDPLGRNLVQPPIKLDDAQGIEPSASSESIPEVGLSDHQITTALLPLRTSFLKCYASLLKSHSESKGEIYVTFTILNNGKMQSLSIIKDSFNDQSMAKCVSDVILRAQFDNFKGDPIVVNYPLYFD